MHPGQDTLAANLHDLERELGWFTRVLDRRFSSYFAREEAARIPDDVSELSPPEYGDSPSAWALFLAEYRLSFIERLALVLALVPHLRPQLLDVFFTKNATFDRRFTEFGGVRTDDAFEPTGETLAFLLGGASLEARVAVTALLDADARFLRLDILRPTPLRLDQPVLMAPLRIAADALSLFTIGRRARAALGAEFPAQRLESALEWDDLVLHPGTLKQLVEIKTFITHGDTLMQGWGMSARLRPGYRALFYGPPGTGKTMSAALLGKLTGRDVYRIDLSLIVSKYIGETAKNLASVFERAQRAGWILFFDEADALFGKRAETKDAHDRYANQEVAYLLQRIETFDGIAILASNLRDNLDQAFSRRFESVVYFALPRPPERLRLWKDGFSARAKFDPSVDLGAVARDYELTGGSIMNVIRHVSLTVIGEGERPITRDDIALGVRREFAKEGRAT